MLQISDENKIYELPERLVIVSHNLNIWDFKKFLYQILSVEVIGSEEDPFNKFLFTKEHRSFDINTVWLYPLEINHIKYISVEKFKKLKAFI